MEELESSAVQAPEQTVPGWYEGVSLEDAELYIHANLKSAARSVIAIGYYLKCVKAKELFAEAGFKDIYDYAKDRFGFSTSTTNRYMSRNDKFSINGNSPILDEKYKDFNKSQLQEMLSLDSEQLEKVTPEMSVLQIREMKKPKEIPYVAIPGQVELTDFPGIEPEDVAAASKAREEAAASQTEKQAYTISAEDLLPDPEPQETEQSIAISQQEPEPAKPIPPKPEQDSCPPGITDCRRQEWGTGPAEQEAGKKECKACWASWKRQHKALGAGTVEQEPEEPQEPLSAYGTPKRVYPEDRLIAMAGCEGGHSCTSCYVECGIRQEDCYCVDAPMGNPFPCDTLKTIQTLRDEIGSKCQFVDHGLAYHRAGDHEPVPCCRECEEPCRYICDRAKKQLEAKAIIPQDDTQQVDPDDEKLPDPDEKWSIGELPQAKESLVRQLARILIQDCGNELRMTPGELGRPSDDTIRKQTDMLVLSNNGFAALPDGVEAYPSEDMIEFFRGDEDLGVCSHARFATQVRRALEDADKAMLAGNKSLKSKDAVQEPDTAENVIDGEFTEIQEPDASDQEAPMNELQIAQEELERAKRLLEKGLGCGVDENDIHIRRLKTAVCAWASYVCDLDSIVNPPPKPVQPELPVLKNNDQRAAFVDAYETWPLWIETAQTGERYYRYDLEDGTSMVVKVYHAKLFYSIEPGGHDFQYREGYGRHEYYLLQPGKFFRDCDTNRSMLIEKLKEIQRPKKG